MERFESCGITELVKKFTAEEYKLLTSKGLKGAELKETALFNAMTRANTMKYGNESHHNLVHRYEKHPVLTDTYRKIADSMPHNLSIVCVGVNDGFELTSLSNHNLSGWGIDIAEEVIAKARTIFPSIKFLHGDGTTLIGYDENRSLITIPNECANLYLSLNTLQSSCIDKKVAVYNASRVLKNDGNILITIPPIFDTNSAKYLDNVQQDIASELMEELQKFFKINSSQERYIFLYGRKL